tara:strand:- start:66 stop:1130 length:1065 start_codon:yes stop_codon:yes gene_type:complete
MENFIMGAISDQWLPFSRIIVKSDGNNWSFSWDAKELKKIYKLLRIPVVSSRYENIIKYQSVFYTSRYDVLANWKKPHHRIAFPYYHGQPSTSLMFKSIYDSFCIHHGEINRVQVTNSMMEDLILSSGIDSHKVFRIPIGINLDYFNLTTDRLREKSRSWLGIPQTAFVIGSFQKDGVGMKEGLDPKQIKGPDIFLKTIKILKDQIPEIFVLLTGPARGYVKNGLENLGVPYLHRYLNDYTDIGRYYNALDLYLISSREEGGPKAVLESMASGIPLVTTRVGQAMDLVKHGENGWMVEPEDTEGLAYWVKYVLDNGSSINKVLKEGQVTATNNSYTKQIHLWKDFMNGFVDSDP